MNYSTLTDANKIVLIAQTYSLLKGEVNSELLF